MQEGPGSFWHDAITRQAVVMMGVSMTFYGFTINGVLNKVALCHILYLH